MLRWRSEWLASAVHPHPPSLTHAPSLPHPATGRRPTSVPAMPPGGAEPRPPSGRRLARYGACNSTAAAVGRPSRRPCLALQPDLQHILSFCSRRVAGGWGSPAMLSYAVLFGTPPPPRPPPIS